MNKIKCHYFQYQYLKDLALLICSTLFCCTHANAVITLENNFLKYEISDKGRNLRFLDKSTGKDYLYSDTVSYCASVIHNGRVYNVQSASINNNILSLSFGKSAGTTKIRVDSNKDHLVLTVLNVTGAPESLTFLNVPLTLEAMPYEAFATCALSLNLFTHVRRLPALQNHLWATCYKKFGMKDAGVAVLGVLKKIYSQQFKK